MLPKVMILIVLLTISVWAGNYQIDLNKPRMVKFISRAPMDNFEGITDKIDGYISWQGENPAEASELYFEVDLNSLDTGIGLRNRHMRENYLETDKYPMTHFTGKILKAEKKGDGEWLVTAQGKMFIHGMEKEMEITGTLKAVESGFHIYSEFVVKLSDFQIKIPKLMFFKIDENMRLQVDFYVEPMPADDGE
ncbi:MAG: hypothetical protein Kow0037_21730 [Calditrichia bacterium]